MPDPASAAASDAGAGAPGPRAALQPRARLTPGEAVAGLTWIVMPGPTLDDDTAALLDRGAGGVVLFGCNVESPEQVRRLTSELRRRARRPLRIAIDQEGGHIVRVGEPLTRFPSAMAIGATRSAGLAYAVARASGLELAGLGIDVVLAPVLDVAADPRNPTIGSRAFGSRPGLVAQLGAAAIRGYLDAGIAPAPKHFPGHGRTPLDSHVERPVVRGGIHALARLDLLPFQAAVAAAAPIVMVSHVAYDELTHGLPATLSKAVMGPLLRSGLGFEGIALTDAMVMDGVAEGRSIPDACVAALRAGADVVMPLEPQRRAILEAERALRDGRLHEDAVAASLVRVEALDRRLRRSGARRTADDAGEAGRASAAPLADLAAHGELAATVARRSLTLVHGRWTGPIDPSTSVLVVEFDGRRASPIEEATHSSSFSGLLASRLPRAQTVHVAPGAASGKVEARAIALARSVELVVLATRDGAAWREAEMLGRAIAATGRGIVHVALRSPRDLALLPSSLGIAAYSDVPASLAALVEALTCPGLPADVRFPGELPMEVELPEERRTWL